MTRLFVGNLSFEVAPVDLQAAFAAYGPVSSADVVDSAAGSPFCLRRSDCMALSLSRCVSGRARSAFALRLERSRCGWP